MTIEIINKYGTFICFVDDEDYSLLQGRKVRYTGTKRNNFYCIIKLNNKATRIHRLIMNCPSDKQVDHINGNTLDNRKYNLRICSLNENKRNRKKSKKAKFKYKGIRLKQKNWQARITFNNQQINLGSYKTEIEAAKAYNTAAIKYFGEFANLNKIEE